MRDDEGEWTSPEPAGAVITEALVDTTLTGDDIAPIGSSVEAATLRAVVADDSITFDVAVKTA